MTLASPTLFLSLLSRLDTTYDSISQQLSTWFFFIIWCFLNCPLGQILRLFASALFYTIFGGPIAIYALFKSVYEFGPEHRRRGLFEILRSPVPPANAYFYTYEARNRVENGTRLPKRKF